MKTKTWQKRIRVPLRSLLILGIGALIMNCSKTSHKDSTVAERSEVDAGSGNQLISAAITETSVPWIGISNKTNRSVEIYDYKKTNWVPSEAWWIFKPTAALGFSANAVSLFMGGGDFRVHYVTGFPGKANSVFAVTSNSRWAGLCVFTPLSGSGYPRGRRLWEMTFPASEDPALHAIELLPNGNVALAGTGSKVAGKGNWVRIYNTSDSPASSNYAEAPLNSAHALLWDPGENVLWAGGVISISGVAYHGVFAYTIGGTRENPTITEDTTRRMVKRYRSASIPDGFAWPHDLQPDYDDTNKMIYSDHTGVYICDKSAKTFTRAPGDAGFYVAPGSSVTIKSAGKQPDGGRYVITETSSSACEYYTSKIQFFDGTSGMPDFTRTLGTCDTYRVRVFTHSYQ